VDVFFLKHGVVTYRRTNHVGLLHTLLPPPFTASQRYNLRLHAHSIQFPKHSTQLSDCTFLTRIPYKNTLLC